MDIRDSFKKYGKQFLKSASAYSKHKSNSKREQLASKTKIPKQETPVLTMPIVEAPKQNPELTYSFLKTEPKYCDKTNYEREFVTRFKQLTYRHHSLEVWSDFVAMFACAISNSLDKQNFDEREKLYLKIIKKYSKDEQTIFPELAAMVVMSLDQNPEQDFLGRIYMNLGLGNKNTAQFFTPYHICQLMADVTMSDIVNEINEKGYISISDPCCGGGALLIAGINKAKDELKKENLNFQNHVLIVAQDIDFTVAMMCYIQISLLGVAGYVKVGNSLTEPIAEDDSLENYWFTPMYFSDVWNTRRILKKMDSLFKEE